jgi:hypothetical protein
MQALSPTAVSTCLLVLEVAGLVGVWLMRMSEKSEFAHSIRGAVILCMVLLGLMIGVSVFTEPRAGLIAGAVLCVMAVLSVIDFGPRAPD